MMASTATSATPAVPISVPTAAVRVMLNRRTSPCTTGSTRYAKPNATSSGTLTLRMAYPRYTIASTTATTTTSRTP